MKFGLIIISILTSIGINAQDIYKTPSGKKYHLSTCRMVENVSKKILGDEEIGQYNLKPCKICNPPFKTQLTPSSHNKAVGEATSVQCKGYTQKGTQCKHKTSLANGYCYQHTKQNSSSSSYFLSNNSYLTSTNCGAKTKSGGYCKRKVKARGRCHQHRWYAFYS